MSEIKYHHALDTKGNLIDINSVTEADRNKEYRCLGCGELLRPRLGNKNAHHFAHKSDVFNCSPETYIHKLAKQKIKEWFDSDKPFKISYSQKVSCADAESCPFHKIEECHDSKLKTYDLKEYYDTCSIEESIGNFTADILLTSQKNSLIPPILIEIQVTHKSETVKLNSGYKIIEIKISSEADIDKLVQSPSIEETADSQYGRTSKQQQPITFYGFKKDASPEHLEMRDIPKFYLFISGKAFVSNIEDYPSCREAVKSDNPRAILELAIDRFYLNWIYEIGYATAKKLGYNVKICQQCKYWRCNSEFNRRSGVCCLYEKYDTPRCPEDIEASNCLYYLEDPDIARATEEAIAETTVVIVTRQDI